jgi:HSP20 family molecular chaperone IbpA
MWSEALERLERADRIERQCFQLGSARHGCATWEPPVDLFETDTGFIVLAALPGVRAEQLRVTLDGARLSVHARRSLPQPGANARIHRVEIPYGRFERHLLLPSRHLRLGKRALHDGCLMLSIEKTGSVP